MLRVTARENVGRVAFLVFLWLLWLDGFSANFVAKDAKI
jgi:hypothetical protein